MTNPWRKLAIAGSFSLALAVPAVSDGQPPEDLPPGNDPPRGAAASAHAGYGFPRTYGPTTSIAPVADPAFSGGVAAPVTLGAPTPAGGPTVVGDYRVGHIKGSGLAHFTGYSGYNPYLDNIHQPFRQVMYGGTHARYYAGYRNIYAPNWHEVYVPRYNAPAYYGYQPYGPSYYGYGQTRSTFYGPREAAMPGTVNTAVPPAPPSSYHPAGYRYTGEPGLYSPFGAGSASYFGAYSPGY